MADERPIAVAIDNQELAGTLIVPCSKTNRAVLFVHGWGGRQEDCLVSARLAAERGFVCMTFDLRGHGRTFDQRIKVTREESLRDVLSAYDVLACQSGVDPNRISIVGFSYGGYLSALATSQRAVSALALRAPAIYKDANWGLAKRKLHEDPELVLYRRRMVSWDDNRALLACVAFTGHVLIVASEYDDVVPAPVSESYAAAFTKARSLTSHVIAGADHALSEERWRREYRTRLLNWLTESYEQGASKPAA